MCVSCQKTNRTVSKKDNSRVCSYLYTELTNLDFQVLDLFKRTKESQYREVNATLRGWINNLNNDCPPYEDLSLIREFIEDEYPKYFT